MSLMLSIILSFTYRAMVQAVSPQFLTSKAQVQPKAILYGSCDGKTDTLAGISPTAMLHTRSFDCRRYIILVTDNLEK